MKKGLLNLIILMFFLIVLSFTVIAAHTATVNLAGYVPNYETNNMQFLLEVKNNFGSTSSITNITVSHLGYTKTFVLNPTSFSNDGDINWYGGLISDGGTQSFRFNATAQLVNADAPFTWTITTTDTAGATQSNTVGITILNDLISPSIINLEPLDYSFVRNDSVKLYINAQELETSLSGDNIYFGYRDSNTMVISGVIANYIELTDMGSGEYSAIWLPNQNLNSFIDYRIVNLSDAAGNNYDEGLNLPHHLYIDKEYPIVTLNQPVNSFLTNQYLHNIIFDMSDNSFEANGQGLFRPEVNCTANIQGIEFGPNSYTNNASNSFIQANLTGLADDYYNFFVYCMDKAGYFSMSDIRTLRLDTTGPVINLNSPVNGSVITNGSLITLSVTDPIAGIDDIWYNNGSENINLFDGTGQSGAGIIIDTSAWNEGANNLIIYSNDTLNNLATPLSLTFFVDQTSPVVNLVSPANNTLVNGNLNFIFNAVDNYDSTLNCQLFVDNILISGISAISGINTTISYNPTIDGNHNWNVACWDDYNPPASSAMSIFNLDTTPPSLPDLTTFNLLNDTNDVDGLIDLNFNIIDSNGLSVCQLSINNILNQTNSTSDFTINLVASNNAYLINIGCNDSINNWYNLPQLTLYYDNIAPVISNVSTSGITTSNAIITWNTDDNANRNLTYWNASISSSFVNVYEQTHSIALSGLSSSTTYNYNVSSSDRWGNVNTLTGFNFITLAESGGGGGSGGSGGGGSSSNSGSCVENWNCGAWNDCIRDGILGVQTRGCTDLNNCGTENYKSALLQNCKLSFEEEQIQENPVEKVQEEIKEGMKTVTGDVVANVINSTPFRAIIVAMIIGLLIAGFLRWMKERPPKKINIVDYSDDGDTPFSME